MRLASARHLQRPRGPITAPFWGHWSGVETQSKPPCHRWGAATGLPSAALESAARTQRPQPPPGLEPPLSPLQPPPGFTSLDSSALAPPSTHVCATAALVGIPALGSNTHLVATPGGTSTVWCHRPPPGLEALSGPEAWCPGPPLDLTGLEAGVRIPPSRYPCSSVVEKGVPMLGAGTHLWASDSGRTVIPFLRTPPPPPAHPPALGAARSSFRDISQSLGLSGGPPTPPIGPPRHDVAVALDPGATAGTSWAARATVASEPSSTSPPAATLGVGGRGVASSTSDADAAPRLATGGPPAMFGGPSAVRAVSRTSSPTTARAPTAIGSVVDAPETPRPHSIDRSCDPYASGRSQLERSGHSSSGITSRPCRPRRGLLG